MSILSFKSAVLSLAIVCFLAGSVRADSFTFTGTAVFGGDIEDFFISGPSFSLFTAYPGARATALFLCNQGTTCSIPPLSISALQSFEVQPGNFSGGTVGGVTAYTLRGSLNLSGSSFTPSPGPNGILGTGPITFTGNLMGFVFLPLGCEKNPFTCTSIGPEVFDLGLSGSGTVTAIGSDVGSGLDGIFQDRYTFSGNASGTLTPVPEPSGLLLVSSGLAVLAGIWRRRFA
jgi:hypothetical protein